MDKKHVKPSTPPQSLIDHAWNAVVGPMNLHAPRVMTQSEMLTLLETGIRIGWDGRQP